MRHGSVDDGGALRRDMHQLRARGSAVSRPPGTRLDGYRLVAHLADGAEAEVHLARSEATGQQVVVKIPHPRTLDQAPLVQRWRREVSLTEELHHPNLQCRVDVGQPRSEPYLVFDYASAGTLRQQIDAAPGSIPVDQVVAWMADLARALGYLHGLGIVHRDLKPENLYVTATGSLKLGDFGAATRAGHGQERRRFFELPTPIEGTPEYLSPEQVLGQPAQAPSDLYSWGVVASRPPPGRCRSPAPIPSQPWPRTCVSTRACPADTVPTSPTGPRRGGGSRPCADAPRTGYASAEEIVADLGRLDRLDHVDRSLQPGARSAVGGDHRRATRPERWSALVMVTLVSFLGVVAAVLALSAVLRGG